MGCRLQGRSPVHAQYRLMLLADCMQRGDESFSLCVAGEEDDANDDDVSFAVATAVSADDGYDPETTRDDVSRQDRAFGRKVRKKLGAHKRPRPAAAAPSQQRLAWIRCGSCRAPLIPASDVLHGYDNCSGMYCAPTQWMLDALKAASMSSVGTFACPGCKSNVGDWSLLIGSGGHRSQERCKCGLELHRPALRLMRNQCRLPASKSWKWHEKRSD
eukprot:gnl/MRDRNA2_/MRDRNA2_39793_c0_seq2.p1 gnl/MRDRNA2_/MRDRNA2_39793_c0~~gnl/MRDRNA2_/MRDRNA2_39793_c0_seq2.p1  ORF type:complete len:216 (-),score=39.51 gnl/MRDRNA2_/MRDRNA2_39793_c0_seq2:82-729(-)